MLGSIGQSRFVCQVWCSSIQGIYLQLPGGGGPSAKVSSSAKFGVAVFKASMLDSLGAGSIGQSRFICQVWCSGIQGIYGQLTRGSIYQSMFHWLSFVYCYSRQISPVRVEISYCHLGVFKGCFGHVLGVSSGVISDITVPC